MGMTGSGMVSGMVMAGNGTGALGSAEGNTMVGDGSGLVRGTAKGGEVAEDDEGNEKFKGRS